jgi:mediator of RNA polymerase II transcription subunit 12
MAPVAAPSPIPATPSSTNTAPAANTVVLSSNDWYTQEFTTMFSSWLRIQLGQLALPAKTTKTGATAAKGPMGVLGDEKARARWLTKWDYR